MIACLWRAFLSALAIGLHGIFSHFCARVLVLRAAGRASHVPFWFSISPCLVLFHCLPPCCVWRIHWCAGISPGFPDIPVLLQARSALTQSSCLSRAIPESWAHGRCYAHLQSSLGSVHTDLLSFEGEGRRCRCIIRKCFCLWLSAEPHTHCLRVASLRNLNQTCFTFL